MRLNSISTSNWRVKVCFHTQLNLEISNQPVLEVCCNTIAIKIIMEIV